MTSVAIENPILNSPFVCPTHYHAFDDDGVTGNVVAGRRPSTFFIPVARPRQRTKQLTFDADWTKDRSQDNDFVNRIRSRVDLWRARGYPSITPVTRALLEHWADPQRHRRLFFCQIEAVETLVFLTEYAPKGDGADLAILNELRAHLDEAGTTLPRVACKMATGAGKTVVMAMVIAWHALNKRHTPNDRRFSNAFLLVAPGITIRDRLRVLLPSDPANYYAALDLVPPEYRDALGSARISVVNYHSFKARDRGEAGSLTKAVLANGRPSPFVETPGQVARRVCRELGNARNIIVLNDEAHHCYRGKPATEKLTGDDRDEAKKREEAVRLWITGLEAIQAKLGVRAVYDLSATPFYLKGSGYQEGWLFPWVVSDFSLIDAIESGIVKVPRVPVIDNTMSAAGPVYRNLWPNIRDGLPKRGRSDEGSQGRSLPSELEGALRSLYGSYEKRYQRWEQDKEAREAGRTPPVFIVVCCNTSVSKMVFDWIAGRETPGSAHPDGTPYVAPGELALFSNAEGNRWLSRPNTILVDSEQFDSGEGMSADFKKLAARQIDEFKEDYRKRFPGRDADELTDEDLMREVLNTVGKHGKLGADVRCVVSVSMLTEGWDANTVTHILGVRAFGTQLLAEQVVGRGLRRMSYVADENGRFSSEYAEVYGVPFTFVPCAGIGDERETEPVLRPGRVLALPERLLHRPWLEITYPRLTGYRWQVPPDRLEANFTDESRYALSPEQFPTWTENAPIVGESEEHTLDALKTKRPQEIAFHLARRVLADYYPAGLSDDGRPEGAQVWLFPQLLRLARRWLDECLTCKDETFPGLMLLASNAHLAAEKIHRAVVATSGGDKLVRAIPQATDTIGSSSLVNFDTTRNTFTTRPDRSHVNFVVCDSTWEAALAGSIERMPEVVAYVKNFGLGLKIPYTYQGRPGNYLPDYIVRLDDGRGTADPLNVVVEVSGRHLEQKEAKVATARNLWVPAVNAEDAWGRWAFLEVTDPYTTQADLRALLEARRGR